MNIIFAVIAGPLIGYFVRGRAAAAAIYLASTGILFTFQTVSVLLAWMADEGGFGGAASEGAFGPAPTGFPIAYGDGNVWSYGLVNLVITLAGLVITLLFGFLRKRSDAKRAARTSVKA